MSTSNEEERNAITILWRIENLSCWEPEFHGKRIYSHNISTRNLGGFKCFLFQPESNASEHVKILSLAFHLDSRLDFPLECEFSFLAADGSALVTGTLRKGVMPLPETRNCMPNGPSHEEVFVTNKSAFLPHDTLTVRCRLLKCESNFRNAEFYSTHSRIHGKMFSILHPMEDLYLKKEAEVPVVLPISDGSVKLSLKFLLRGESLEDSELFFEVEVREIQQELWVKFHPCILSNTREVMKFREHEHRFRWSKKSQTRIFPSIGSLKDLQVKKSPSVYDEVLYIFCNCIVVGRKISNFPDTELIGTSNLQKGIARMVSNFSGSSYLTSLKKDAISGNLQHKDQSLDALIKDFQLLYQEQTLSDFELRSSDVSFRVHKVVLSARSPVFKAMFSSKMKESESNFLDVPDVDVHSLNRMLTFLYTSCVEPGLHVKSAVDLYYAADKYQVDSLREECSAILRSLISVSNVSDFLRLADKHQDKKFMSIVHDFILSHFDDVMVSDEWEKFLETDPYLAGKTAHSLFKDRKNLGLKTIN